MGKTGQAQTGTLNSTPKLTTIKGDDNMSIIYKNMGNNHSYPVMWAETVVLASGTSSLVVASGIKFHGMDVASYAKVMATPGANVGYLYITKDTSANTVTITSSAAASADVDVDVFFMMGSTPSIDTIWCRGNSGASQSLP